MSTESNENEILRRPRRIVTGHDEIGQSIFVSDGPSPNLLQPGSAEGLGLFNLWKMGSVPGSYAGNEDAAPEDVTIPLSPPEGGLVFRIVELPPDGKRNWENREAVFREYGDSDALDLGSPRHPGFHKTHSIDFAVVLQGEVWALMDIGETLMKPGDTLVQRGTNHAWSNRTDAPVRIMFVLVSAHSL